MFFEVSHAIGMLDYGPEDVKAKNQVTFNPKGVLRVGMMF